MRVNMNDKDYAEYIEEQRRIFKARMLDYFIARKSVVEGVKRRDNLETIEESSVDVRNALGEIARIAMLLLEDKLFFDIDRRIFQISPDASEYQYDKDGNAWIDRRFKKNVQIPDISKNGTHVIEEV